MNSVNCPYLGLKEDPTTALDFPSQGNFCHHARPVAPVKGTYQQQYCLTSAHTACPVFQAANLIPLPLALVAPDSSPAPSRRMLVILGIPVLLAGTAALAMGWNAINPQSVQSNAIADTGGAIPSAWALLSTQPESTPSASPTATPSAEPMLSNCPLPAGWVPYMVNPTDSLFRLSVIYGVSVEQLQQVNCMGDKTTILPGQVIYVPNPPTETPTPTATPIPVIPTNIPSSANSNSQPASPTATPVPPTAANPPTAVPPTAVPTSQPTNPPPKIKPTNPPSGHSTVAPNPKPKTGGNDKKGGKGNGKGNGKGRGKG